MDADGSPAELLSPVEAEWPPELRLPPPPRKEPPPPPPLPPPRPTEPAADTSPPRPPPAGIDDSQFLGSIMEAAAVHGDPPPPQVPPEATTEAPVVVKRKRGRPPKNRDGAVVPAAAAAAKPARRREDKEEVVCFICFDGGDLVVCDRRGCPKVYHPACIKRDESFFQSRGKWDCGWHICSSCEKAVHFMCYTCTYSLCKGCIKQGKFFSVRGTKGFCETCFGTIMLIESKDEDDAKVGVDFDDQNSWEYLFKLYWLDLKGKLSLTLAELISAKSQWNVCSTYVKKEKEESSDELYDANNDRDASSDSSSGKRKRTKLSSKRRGRKRQSVNSDCGIAAKKADLLIKNAEILPKKVPYDGMTLPEDTKWASPELLEFVGHMRDGDRSFISQFDVQALLLEYIKRTDLRDPRRKSQIICDARLNNLFGKPRVGHFEMLKLLEMHFLVKETSTVNNGGEVVFSPDSAQMDTGGYSDVAAKLYSDKRRRIQKKIEREQQANPEDYAAIDVHNINLIYLHRSLMEDLIDDDATFSDKIAGAFVRIRIPGVGQKQDMYRLVKVLGTRRVREKYNVGKKTTNFALEILNLDKTEVITVDTISNQDFTEEECKRLRQSIKCGLINRLKVGDIREKAKIFQSVRVNDWLENEKQRLSHLRDRASETGRRKELRECVEKLQLLNTHEERTRRINEVPEVHADPHMDPDYESAEELDDKKAGKDVDQMATRTGSNLLFSGRKGTDSNYVQSHAQKNLDSSHHRSGSMSTESIIHKSGAGSNSGSLHSMIGWENPKPHINVNSTEGKVASLSSSGVSESSDMEPEKVWHYKDPSGNIQGPFTLSQLAKWRSYFPRDMRVWLTFESEENSLLLTELLSKQQKDFIQPTSITASNRSMWASTRQNRSNSNVDQKDNLSPVGYSIPNPSGLANHSTNCSAHSAPKRGDLSSSDRRLPSARSAEPPKDAHTLRGQVQHQINYSGIIPSSASLYGQPHLYQGVQGGHFSGWNNGGMWSSTKPQASCSGHSDIEPHPNWHNSGSQSQNDSKSNLQSRSTKDLNSQWTSSQILPAPYPQQIGRDASNIVGASSPSESKTTSGQQEGSCWSSTTNPGTHDELIFSIASAKPNIHASATPVEDRGSSSPSGLPSQSERATGCSPPQSAPSASVFASKMEETMNQNKTCEPDASNASVNQSPHSKMEQVLSPDIQYLEREYPSPTPRSERREPSANLSLSTSSENLATKVPDHSQIALASETSGQATCEIGGLQSLTSLEDKYLEVGGPAIQTEELNKGSTGVNRESIAVNPISGAESIAMSDVLEPLPEQSCGTSNMHEPAILEDFTAASAEVEHEPQCSSPIALSPWNESSYYQGEAVDSALWGVQDYPTNEMWSLPSPTPALQPSTGIGTDGKNSSSGIDEVIVGNSDIAQGIQIPGEKKMQQADESASTAWRLLEPVKSKPSSTSGPLAEGGARVLGQQSSAHESSNVNSTWSANQNHNLASSYDTVAPTNKNYLEAPNRQGNIDMYAAREALGNTDKNWNSSAGNANWSSQWSQHHDRYSHGIEHWRGTSIYSRSRSDGFGSGVSSRSSTSRGQSQRGICKFHESGYCRKGASCNYLHP